MTRIQFDLPKHFLFKTELGVRTLDLEPGGHLSSQALLLLLNEARMKFFHSLGYGKGDVEGAETVLADAAMVHETEGVPGESLAFEVTAGDFSRTGCDLFYRVTDPRTGAQVAKGKTGIDFIDHKTRVPTDVPSGFRTKFI